MSIINEAIYSADKSEKQYAHSNRMTEQLTCSKITQANSAHKEHTRTQPIKVTELLNFYGKAKSASKAPVRTRHQPERLTILYPEIKSAPCNQKHKDERRYMESGIPERNVRRNLNIAFQQTDQFKENKADDLPKSQKKNMTNQSMINCKSNRKTMASFALTSKTTNHRSSLLPPNVIKGMYIRKQSQREEFKEVKSSENFSTVHKTDSTNKIETTNDFTKNNSIQETAVNNNLPAINITSCFKNQSTHECLKNDNNNTDGKTDRHIDTPVTSQSTITRKSLRNMLSPKNILGNDTSKISHENNFTIAENLTDLQRLNDDLHNVSIYEGITKLNINNNSNDNINNKLGALKYLEDNIKQIIRETEENITKLRLGLDCIETLKNCMQNKLIDKEIQTDKPLDKINEEIQIDIPLNQIDKGVQVDVSLLEHFNTDTKLIDINETNLEEVKENNAAVEADTSINLIQFSISGMDEENQKDFNKNETFQSVSTEDSFLRLENEFNIQHTKPNNQINNDEKISLFYNTPVSKKEMINKSKRSLREYTLLKSRMNFLETPDVKRFQSFTNNTNKTEATSNTYLSTRVLTEIQNLYTESSNVEDSIQDN